MSNGMSINKQSMNMILQQTATNTPEARRLKRQIPDEILEQVETERLYRFGCLIEVQPEKLLHLCRNKLLPWS